MSHFAEDRSSQYPLLRLKDAAAPVVVEETLPPPAAALSSMAATLSSRKLRPGLVAVIAPSQQQLRRIGHGPGCVMVVIMVMVLVINVHGHDPEALL